MRPKTSGRHLPPRMLKRTKKLKSGMVWVGYYYNGRNEDGHRVEIPLGTDLNEAKRKWAELDCKPAPVETGLMQHIFDRYLRDIVPAKAPRTQKDNRDAIKQLRTVFDTAPIDAITPQHIAQYRDKRSAKVRANREITLLSHIFNMAREWGYTAKDNPARGIRKNKEQPRDFYADDAVWDAVYKQGTDVLKNAMDIAYLTGQRPADVVKIRLTDIRDDALEIQQNKTSKRLRILLNYEDGTRSELGKVIDRIIAASGKVISMHLLVNTRGEPLTQSALRHHFDHARTEAATNATEMATRESLALAERIRKFQFRDARPKAASEIGNLAEASKLLGHTEQEITKKVYRRVGETVKPTK